MNLDVETAVLLAKASFIVPHKPLGSAAETATPTNSVLSNTPAHSSGVKSCLVAINGLLRTARATSALLDTDYHARI
jgi:hypothetical protein